ncbi:MAG: LAGLIDADG family homing endonuclease [Casimicrobiaceae bacterium]
MAPNQTKRLTDDQAAYIAGLVDGEGTVTLSAEHRGERRRIVVSISNTELPLLTYVLEAAGVGKITNKRVTKPDHTPSFAYRVTSRQAIALLAQIHPFLRSYKAKRAELALAQYVVLTPRNGKYSKDVAQQRHHFEGEFLAIRASTSPVVDCNEG